MEIPKIIHYCWFGRGEKNELMKKCINSWKKYLPNFEIIEWNEDNFDINCNSFVRRAMKYKKYAFVADYVRTWALYNYGGIYLDTDQEIIENMDDIIKNKAFIGMEDNEYISCGIMGTIKHVEWMKNILDLYNRTRFNPYDLESMLIPKLYTKELIRRGIKFSNDMISYNDIITIYPSEYFYPIDFKTQKVNITNNTVAIHHWNASWKNKNKIKFTFRVKSKIYYIFKINI